MSFFEKLFGSFSDKELKRINPLKDKVLALEPEMAKLTDDELKAKTTEFKERLAKGETLDDLLFVASVLDAVVEAAQDLGGVDHRFLLAHLGGLGIGACLA